MAIPTPPGAAASTVTPATAAQDATPVAEEVDDDKKAAASAIKQFGPSEDADGNPVAVPSIQGVVFTELVNETYSAIAAILGKRGITDVEGFVTEAEELDKTTFPGNKAGRVSYNLIRGIANIYKQYAVFNKVRGVGGAAALKVKLAEKEGQVDLLQKKLAELEAKFAKLGGG